MKRFFTHSIVVPILLGLAVVVVWQLVVDLAHVQAYILPAPLKILSQISQNTGQLLSAIKVSGGNALIGLVLGSLWALVVALIAHQWRLLDGVFGALAAGAAAIPIVAMAPLFYGMFSATAEYPRCITVAALVFFPIYANVSKGLKQVAPVHRDLMHALAASRWQTARALQLPIAVPYLFSGLRVAAPGAVIVSIVSEYFGGPENGLGNLISTAASASSYDLAWAFVTAAVALGLIAFILGASAEALVNRRLRISS